MELLIELLGILGAYVTNPDFLILTLRWGNFDAASGRKLTVGTKRPANLGVMNKSQTLPRSMGGTKVGGSGGQPQRPVLKSIATPPAVRRQLSVS